MYVDPVVYRHVEVILGLARRQRPQGLDATALATDLNVATATVTDTLRKLAAAGLLWAGPGQAGPRFGLARMPETITLAEVTAVAIRETNAEHRRDRAGAPDGPQEAPCALSDWIDTCAQRLMADITVADLLDEPPSINRGLRESKSAAADATSLELEDNAITLDTLRPWMQTGRPHGVVDVRAYPMLSTPYSFIRRMGFSSGPPDNGPLQANEERQKRFTCTHKMQRSRMSSDKLKVVCVLYDDPVDGYPPQYARYDIPKLERYPDGMSLPTPKSIDFTPGELLGCVSGELGLRDFLESQGHELVVTSDKDGAESRFERELPDADIVISQPFWPAYLTADRIQKAANLKLAITAGIGSDHVDLQAASEHNVTVAEVTYCNSISVAEHVVMQALALVRNFIPSHQWVRDGGWNIADSVKRAYDIEGMKLSVLGGSGRIGYAVMKRLAPFDMELHYTDRYRLPEDEERALGATYHKSYEDAISQADVVSINIPLHSETEHLFDDDMLAKMKPGSYLINTARGKICDRDAVVRALESGQLAGYAGDVWFPQPAPENHPWRTMPNHAMTPHTSGTTLSAQARYAAGTREILECFIEGREIRDDYLILQGGKLAGVGAKSYSEGNTTSGSEEAAKFKSTG